MKKVYEFVVLCDVEVVFIIFFSIGKLFEFVSLGRYDVVNLVIMFIFCEWRNFLCVLNCSLNFFSGSSCLYFFCFILVI